MQVKHALPFGVSAMIAILCGCHSQRARNASNDTAVSDVEVGNESVVLPTNDASFQLLGFPPEYRKAKLQSLLASLGKQCNYVISTSLQDGFEGTDLWRIQCLDGGLWLMTFANNGNISAEDCKSSPTECTPGLRSAR